AIVSNRNDHVAALWQLAAALIAAGCVRRIARLCGGGSTVSWAAAFLFLLLPQTVVQSAVVGNDLLLAALTAFAVERVLRYADDRRRSHLAWLAVTVGLGLGMKLSFVCQIGMLAVVAVLAIRTDRRRAGTPVAAALAIGVILALPAGYVTNVRQWGSPVGPPAA